MSRPTYDVAVVGGGIVGTAIAWRFAQRKLRVAVFERSRSDVRNGPASQAAAGILSAQIEGEGPGAFFDLLYAAEEAHAQLAVELRTEVGYRRLGVLRVASDEAELAALARERQWQHEQGLSVDALDPAALRALEPALSPAILGASFFARGGQVDAQALLATLRARGEQAGVDLQAAAVGGVQVEGGRVRGLRLAEMEISAPLVVIAAGAWSSGLQGLGFVPNALRPIRGQLIELEGTARPLSRVVFGAGGYVVPRRERVLVGSTMEEVGFEGAVTADVQTMLRERGARLVPGLENSRTIDAWYGFRPATADGLPAIGPTAIEGLHLALGFLRNGILLAPLLAELVVRAALGEASAIPRPFAASRLLC